jgi:PAS domain S-box-containing protein
MTPKQKFNVRGISRLARACRTSVIMLPSSACQAGPLRWKIAISTGNPGFRPFFAIWMTDDRSVDPSVALVRDATARGTVVEQIEAEKALRESEARFRELADNISQFAWTADQSGWIYRYNKRWHDYTGTTLKEMEGWGWQKVHHPEHVDRVVERIRQSFETGTPWEDTFPLRGRDGNYRWFLSRALPIRNEAGEVIRWFGTNTDITEQIEAEKALRELNETLEQRVQAETRERVQIWSVSQDLLVVADLRGIYLSVNPAWTTTLGWSASELVGKTSQWLLHPDDREKTRAEISGLAAGKKTPRFENRFRHKEGSYRWISWNAAPDRGRIYAMGRDVTDLKEAENTLKETREELARGAQRTMLAAMSAALAHEISQPLAAIETGASAGLRWLNRATPDVGGLAPHLSVLWPTAVEPTELSIRSGEWLPRPNERKPLSISVSSFEKLLLWCATI